MVPAVHCKTCGRLLPPRRRAGRPRHFCDDVCKQIELSIAVLERHALQMAARFTAAARAHLRSRLDELVGQLGEE